MKPLESNIKGNENVIHEDELQEEINKKLGLTKRRTWLMFSTLLSLYVLSGMMVSIQAPFYPQEAISKNLTATEYGLVFGTSEITGCLTAFPLAMVVHSIGMKLAITCGTTMTGSGIFLFGFLKFCNMKMQFFSLSIILRILEGFGKKLTINGALTTVTTTLPKSSTSKIAYLESAYGVGMIISPVFGGVLFDLGGFLLPFLTLGSVIMLTIPFSTCLIPSDRDLKELSQTPKSLNWFLLCVSEVWFGISASVSGMMVMGFLTAHLGTHLETFHLTGTYRGLIFYAAGMFYAVSAPLWAKLCEHGLNPIWCIFFACLSSMLGICLVGPAPFLPFDKSIWLIIPGVILVGMGVGGCVPMSFIYNRNTCSRKGIPCNRNTNAMLSGLYLAASDWGSFIGSFLGGLAHDAVGFSQSSMIPFGANALIVLLALIFYFKGRYENKLNYQAYQVNSQK